MNCLFKTPLFGFRCGGDKKRKQKSANSSKIIVNHSKERNQNNKARKSKCKLNNFKTSDVTFSNSQSQKSSNTKSTSAMNSVPSGVPFEISIGRSSFDACDEVSLISFSTLRNPGSFENCYNMNHNNGEMNSNYRDCGRQEGLTLKSYQENKWLTGTNNLSKSPERNIYQHSLGMKRDDDSEIDEKDIDNETISNYTRISI